MATTTVTYSESELDNFCKQYNYQAQILDPQSANLLNPEFIDNPESKEQFLSRKLTEFLTQSAKDYKIKMAQEAAKILAGGQMTKEEAIEKIQELIAANPESPHSAILQSLLDNLT